MVESREVHNIIVSVIRERGREIFRVETHGSLVCWETVILYVWLVDWRV